eukprot:4999719-Ditylum_brightwellii.AAC.2
MKEFEVDIWLWTETNVYWSKKMIKEAEQMGSKIFDNLKLSHPVVMTQLTGNIQEGHVWD